MKFLKKQKKGESVTWDDQKLKEDDQNRGKYQKIDEPKTPFRGHDSDVQSFDDPPSNADQLEVQQILKLAEINKVHNLKKKVDIAALNAKLEQEKALYSSQSSEEQEQEDETKQKKKDFQDKVKNFFKDEYCNAKKSVQKLKQENEENWESDDLDI